jgi:hypothetical protein
MPNFWRKAAPALAVALLLSSCSTSGFQYVSSAETNTVFKVPEKWTLFSEDDVFRFRPPEISPQQEAANRASQWVMAFDGASQPTLTHLFNADSTEPAGYAKVRILSDEERAAYSLSSLRNEEFEIDKLVRRQQLELLSEEEVSLDSGVNGVHLVFNVRQGPEFITVNQTALKDPQTRVLYLFLIGCQADCYESNQGTIDEVVNSWTIKER